MEVEAGIAQGIVIVNGKVGSPLHYGLRDLDYIKPLYRVLQDRSAGDPASQPDHKDVFGLR